MGYSSLRFKCYSADQLQWHNEKVALVFGNEVTGVSDEVLQAADGCIEIPKWGSKHSLNISVSVGVVLWKMVKSMTWFLYF